MFLWLLWGVCYQGKCSDDLSLVEVKELTFNNLVSDYIRDALVLVGEFSNRGQKPEYLDEQ